MKLPLILVFLAMAGSYASDGNGSNPNRTTDRLLPLSRSDETLRSIIEEKLVVSPANYGRMIHMYTGHEGSESAVSVYCDETSPIESTCHVTATRAIGSFEYVLSEFGGSDDLLYHLRNISVQRNNADIPHSIATAFRSCLIGMMPVDGDSPQIPTISDNDRVEFWLVEPGGISRSGERGERPSKRISALVRVGVLLSRYCEASTQKRGSIIRQIRRELDRMCSRQVRPKGR